MNLERRSVSRSQSKATVQRGHGRCKFLVGHAAVFYKKGEAGTEYRIWPGTVERVMPGAFDRAILEGDDVRALFNHDPNLLLGRTSAHTLRLDADEIGLRYRIIPDSTTVGQDVLKHAARGDLSGASFSFTVDDETWTTDGDVDVREIRSVKLFDISPTVFPAYKDATSGLGDGSSRGVGLPRRPFIKLESMKRRQRLLEAMF